MAHLDFFIFNSIYFFDCLAHCVVMTFFLAGGPGMRTNFDKLLSRLGQNIHSKAQKERKMAKTAWSFGLRAAEGQN